jgi:hypothetical protein
MKELVNDTLSSPVKHKDSKLRNISRRNFGRQAALGLGSLAVLPPLGLAGPTEKPLSSQSTPNDQHQFSAESSAEIEARMQAILGKYGSRFTNEEKDTLRGFVVDFQRSLDRLRQYPLDNWDESVAVVRPLKTRRDRSTHSK